MRRTLGWMCILALGSLCWGAQSGAPAKKTATTSTKKAASTKKAPAPGNKAATAPAKAPSKASVSKGVAKRGKKSAPKVTWRNRQTAPTPERYKEIQDALAAKGYLKPEDANGTWGPGSADALKKFQAEQNIEATGKINSLSLIALGLGPRRDATPPPKPADPPPAK